MPRARLAQQALIENIDIADLVVASGLLPREQVVMLLAADRLTGAQRKH